MVVGGGIIYGVCVMYGFYCNAIYYAGSVRVLSKVGACATQCREIQPVEFNELVRRYELKMEELVG